MATFFKNDAKLSTIAVGPAKPITQLPPSSSVLGAMARSYNMVGGLIDELARLTAIDAMAVLAVWYVESGSSGFVPGRPVLRFENHKFWKYWGLKNTAKFNRHFVFGGYGQPGSASHNHLFRNPENGAWRQFHGKQASEYEVLEFAIGLASKDEACMSASFGGPQIMGFNHNACGYATAGEMFDAFGNEPRWQVLGFFDFCRMNGLIPEIRNQRWIDFGAEYNGDGATYGPRLATAFKQKSAFAALPR